MYHLEFTDGSNPYVGFTDDLDKWKENYLITPTEAEGFYLARPAKIKIFRSKITRTKDRYDCYHYEYELQDKVLHFESYDKLSPIEALQRLYQGYPDLLLKK